MTGPDARRVAGALAKALALAVAIAVALALVAGLALRFHGERRFARAPETVPDPPPAGSALVERVDALLGVGDAAVAPLPAADDALLARLELADAAGAALDVQYYGFHHDASGRTLLAHLAAAAARDVTVRLLVDDIGIGERADCLGRLDEATPNLSVRIFNLTLLRGDARLLEFLARFPRATRRMHNKAMTADRAVTIVGGRNVSDAYFDVDVEAAYADFDVMVAGRAANDAAAAFDRYWYGGLAVDAARLAADGPGIDCDGPGTGRAPAAATDPGPVLRRLAETGFRAHASLVVDAPDKVLPGPGGTLSSTAAAVRGAMGAARRTLRLASPYFIPREGGLELLAGLRERGVEVDVLTNSMASNDVALVHASYRRYRRRLLELGVRLHEFKPRGGSARSWSLLDSDAVRLHAKTFVVDERTAFVGSFNLDPRSFFENAEMGVLVEAPVMARDIATRWSRNLPRIAYRLALDAEGRIAWHERLDDGTERIWHHDPRTTQRERLAVRALGWLPLESLM